MLVEGRWVVMGWVLFCWEFYFDVILNVLEGVLKEFKVLIFKERY